SCDGGIGCFVTIKNFLFGLLMLFMDRVTGLDGTAEDIDVESTGCGFGKGLGEVCYWMIGVV
ncbi:hypothetical protein A2U01_0103783, partial [Trifolium medium]|nr:hypothetical protein [Trifolium medium]